MKTSTTPTPLSSLRPGEQFYFCDSSMAGGVNRLTCYRRTPHGITNGVTRRRSTFAKNPALLNRPVVPA